MKVYFLLVTYSLCLLFISSNQVIAEQIILTENTVYVDVSDRLSYLEDPTCQESFEDVATNDTLFLETESMLNFGVSTSCYWVKLELTNNSKSANYQLILEHSILDQVSFYSKEGLQASIDESNTYYDRDYDDPNFIFDINLGAHQKGIYYLKIKSSELIVLPVRIGTREKILSYTTLREMLFGIYAGVILVMFFYNIFVYFSVRDRSYLYYVIYILLIGLTQASLKGFTSKYLWPGSEFLLHYSVTLLSSLSGIAAIEFVKVFLRSKEFDPVVHKVSYGINLMFVVSIVLCLSDSMQLSFSLMQLSTGLGSIYALVLAVRIYRKGYRPAKFFLIAWSILLLGALTFVLKDFEVLPFNLITNYSLVVASILEVVLLSFALADKINILRVEKEASQLEALKALEENERIVREQNIILESKVEERTAALKKANEDLNEALFDLKEAQSQLVSHEKMASLGQLTAGIAHEINNPINFVKSSVKPLRDNMKEIMELLDEYDRNISSLDNDKITSAVANFKKKIEFDYLIEETKDVIDNIEEGAKRTVEIVSGLRTFSHVDDLGLKQTDLNKGIKSTLKMLLGEIPDNLKVKLELSDIKLVECYGGKINQVFMNVINNAIQAIKEKGNDAGEIVISSDEVDDGVKITIKDNGVGMKDEILDRIFDPFFTTKDVGAGTGLGLSVVYGIVESHHGKIDVKSIPNEGSTFVLTLPYIQPK